MVAQPRFNAVLVAAFGLSALLLSVIGVYGLITNAVSARKREIGLRIALGAHPGKVMRHVVGGAVLATGAGITLGLVLSLALARLITSLLFGVEPLDPATYVLVVVVVLVVAVAAATVPSWRAAKLDPAAALREE
jgi:ABC-type antimicrobial peptide transport system permease subunit